MHLPLETSHTGNVLVVVPTIHSGPTSSRPGGISMRGDRVEVVVDVGQGTKTYEIVATKAGRRVEVGTVRGTVEVSEVTRNGEVVRTGRFMATRVVAGGGDPPGEENAAQEGGPTHPTFMVLRG